MAQALKDPEKNKKFEEWKDKYTKAKNAYEPQLERMKNQSMLYDGDAFTRRSKNKGGGISNLKSENVRNITYELIETEVDSSIPMPKVTAIHPEDAELAQIAGYLHDIGNVINRVDHAQSGAVMAFRILDHMGADPEDVATIITAIGNHDEKDGVAVDAVTAALIIADKTDVRRSRVMSSKEKFDIHDRVNYAVTHAEVEVDKENMTITLKLEVDEEICSMYEYFEIFLGRMEMSRKAAAVFGTKFKLTVNGSKVL